jgi:hypothetical protein
MDLFNMMGLPAFGTIPKFLVRKDAIDTSKEASVSVDTKTIEKLVWEVIRSHPDGCISDEVLAELNHLPYSSVTARYQGLLRKKLIIDTGDRRNGRSGKPQRVMKAVYIP